MKTITVGVLGAGRIGRLHTDNLLRMPGVRVKAVADPFVDFASWPPQGVRTGADPELVLGDDEIEAVLICSPTPTHAPLTEAAAAAGKHVFCEKPIDLEPDRIRRTLEAVDRAGVKLQVGFNRRFDPTFARVRRAVVEGDVGTVQIVKITSRDPEAPPVSYVQSSGGIFLDMTIHDFDMVRFLTGGEVAEVFAMGAVLIDPAIGAAGDVDTAVTTMVMADGALAVIENSRQAVYGYDQRVEVFGSAGSAEAGNETPNRVTVSCAGGVRADNPLYFFLERYQASFVAEMEAFFASIRENREPPVGGLDGLMSVLVGRAAARSLAEGRPVRVEAP
ncbi:MAG TPA: inositol 2-dehydrogenase [Candidatus Sulfomarinibacteraceae bacterium]|nr:inositol 2-dehydrogenase [Candidatus Sulfomarinibacteraceae bacterium]